MTIGPGLISLRQEVSRFMASLGYIVKSSLKNTECNLDIESGKKKKERKKEDSFYKSRIN